MLSSSVRIMLALTLLIPEVFGGSREPVPQAEATSSLPPVTNVLPQPASYTTLRGGASVGVAGNFTFLDVSTVASDVITEALPRYQHLIFGASIARDGAGEGAVGKAVALAPDRSRDEATLLDELHVTVAASEVSPKLSLETDESYELVVLAPRATLRAATAFGALRGLETFSQLLQELPSKAASGAGGVPAEMPFPHFVAPSVNISDRPRFPFRGLMVDPARRFLPLPLLEAVVDSMAYAKLNVLHLHMTDDQSWPMEVAAFPELTERGAFSPDHTYSAEDMQGLREYARLRGVRVILEIDMPGHSSILALAKPEVLTSCPGVAPYGLDRANLDPTKNATFDFIHTLLKELVTDTFTDDYLFLGGDEVDTRCWANNSDVTAWLAQQGMQVSELQAYFERKLVDMVRGDLKKEVVVWQEVFQNAGSQPILGENAVVDVWKGGEGKGTFDQKVMADVTASELRAMVSSCWYLDIFAPGQTDWGREWVDYYRCDPQDFNGTAEMKARVIGGHGAIWGEATDATNLLPIVWPRLAATAERLWSLVPAASSDFTDFARRLHVHRCRLLDRGIAAGPVGTLGDPYVPGNLTIGPGSRTYCAGDVRFQYQPAGALAAAAPSGDHAGSAKRVAQGDQAPLVFV